MFEHKLSIAILSHDCLYTETEFSNLPTFENTPKSKPLWFEFTPGIVRVYHCGGHPPSSSARNGLSHASSKDNVDMPDTAPPGLPESGPRAAL